MATKTYKWEGTGTLLPSGHRIFETHDHPDGLRWAIADDSGRTPNQTDDGVLWLDRDWPLGVNFENAAWVPVKRDRDGERFSVNVGVAGVLYLSRLFRWAISDVDSGRYFNVR